MNNNQNLNNRNTLDLQEFISSELYESSLEQARQYFKNKPSSLEQNPIYKKIKNELLTIEEKKALVSQERFPSQPEDVLYQWIAPAKITVKRDKQWYINVALMGMFIIFFGILVKNMMIVAVILSLIFALYINVSLPAPMTIYKLTKQGIEIGQGKNIEIYPWEFLLEYAYYYKEGQEFMYVYTFIGSPERIQVLYSEEDRKFINMIMEIFLPYKAPPKKQGWFSKWTDGIYIPLNEFKAIQEKIDQFQNIKYSKIIETLKRQGQLPENLTAEYLKTVEETKLQNIAIKMKKIKDKEIENI